MRGSIAFQLDTDAVAMRSLCGGMRSRQQDHRGSVKTTNQIKHCDPALAKHLQVLQGSWLLVVHDTEQGRLRARRWLILPALTMSATRQFRGSRASVNGNSRNEQVLSL